MASEDEKVVAYLEKHKIKAVLEDIEAKLVKELPPDPIAFLIAKLQALERASKKSPVTASAAASSPKRIASAVPKPITKSVAPPKSSAAASHHPPGATTSSKASSSPSTTSTPTTTTTKGTTTPSRPATTGSRAPARPKATPSPSGATRPATAIPTASATKGGKGPAAAAAGGKTPTGASAKAIKPVAKPKVGGAKGVVGAKEETTPKSTTVKSVSQKEEEEVEGVANDEEIYAGGREEEEGEEELGVVGDIAGVDGCSLSESDEDDLVPKQDGVQVEQLLDAHRRARLPRKCCSKAQAILERRTESPSLGYVSDTSEDEENVSIRPPEDEVKLAEKGVTNPSQKVELVSTKAIDNLDSIRSLLCERCVALLSNETTPAARGDRESLSPVSDYHQLIGAEVVVKNEAALSAQRDRYGWGQ